MAENKVPSQKQDEGATRKIEPQKLFIEIDPNEIVSAKLGEEAIVKLPDGTEYSLVIKRSEEMVQGIISIIADVDDKETGMAIFIVREGKISGKVDMYTADESYTIGHDSTSNRHYIVPIIPGQQDVLEGEEPLTPPKKRG